MRSNVYVSSIHACHRRTEIVASALPFTDARLLVAELNAGFAATHPGQSSWTRPLALIKRESQVVLVEVPDAYVLDSHPIGDVQ